MLELVTEFTVDADVHRAVFSPNSDKLALATASGTIEVWTVPAATRAAALAGHESDVWSVAYARDESSIASGDQDGHIRVWDAGDGSACRILNGHRRAVTALAYSPDGQRLASAGWDNRLVVWDLRSGREESSIDATATLAFGGFASGGRVILTGSDANQAEVWSAETGARLRPLAGGRKDCELRTAVSGDGVCAFTAEPSVRVPPGQPVDSLVSVRIWNPITWRELTSFEVHGVDGFWHFAVARDGRFLLLGSSDGRVKLVRAATGTVEFEAATVDGKTGPECVALSGDDSLMASTAKRTVRLWRVQVPDWAPPAIPSRKPWWRLW